jgi:hypothetical protein
MLLGPFLLDPQGQFRPNNHLKLLSLERDRPVRLDRPESGTITYVLTVVIRSRNFVIIKYL